MNAVTPPIKPHRINVLGVPVDCVDMGEALSFVDNLVQKKTANSVIAVNPEKVIKARNDSLLLDLLDSSTLLIPDGIGVVMASRILGLGRMERVPGSELMPEICKLASEKGYRVFLFGASDEVNRKTAKILEARYHGINIVGQQHGYVEEREMPALIDRINRSNVDILFVALGSPRQEAWIAEHLPKLNVGLCQGVGGTFDVITGRVRRAPKSFRKVHLEWFYRLITQPSRLIRQTALPKFLLLVFWKRVFG